MSDFGFLTGRWTIRHQRLTEVMSGCTEWTRFQTGYEAWQLLGGLANMDRTYGEVDGAHFEGVSVRTFDPETGEWTIYWMDIWNTTLREQVRGRFEDGVGTFYGTERHQGIEYRMRFVWKDITATTARWEQAYQDPDSGEWETNWIMEFTREGDTPDSE